MWLLLELFSTLSTNIFLSKMLGFKMLIVISLWIETDVTNITNKFCHDNVSGQLSTLIVSACSSEVTENFNINNQNENLNLLLCVATTIEIKPLSLCGLNPVIMWSEASLVCSIVTVSPLSGISNYHRSPGWLGHFQSWQRTFAKFHSAVPREGIFRDLLKALTVISLLRIRHYAKRAFKHSR